VASSTGKGSPGDTKAEFPAKEARFVKVTCTGTSAGGWASIREITVKAEGVKALAPKLSDEMKKAA